MHYRVFHVLEDSNNLEALENLINTRAATTVQHGDGDSPVGGLARPRELRRRHIP